MSSCIKNCFVFGRFIHPIILLLISCRSLRHLSVQYEYVKAAENVLFSVSEQVLHLLGCFVVASFFQSSEQRLAPPAQLFHLSPFHDIVNTVLALSKTTQRLLVDRDILAKLENATYDSDGGR